MVKCQAEGLFYSGCCTKPTGRAQTGTFTSHGSEVGASFQVPAAFLLCPHMALPPCGVPHELICP